MEVGRNLHSALAQLRLDTETQWFWVDAICINQADIPEKNHQILLMRDIYRRAAKTYVWLGPDDDDSDLAMMLINLLMTASKKATGNDDKRNIYALGANAPELYNIPPKFHHSYNALLDLFKRPWFRRVWIVQEVAVSKIVWVVCGSYAVPWDDLVKAIDYACVTLGALLMFNNGFGPSRVVQIQESREADKDGTGKTIIELLMDFRYFEATNERDKVYALCGLATDSGPEGLNIVPDYGLSVPYIYKSVAIKILIKTQTLDLLSMPRVAGPTSANLPSWVPDWSVWDFSRCLADQPTSGTYVYGFESTPTSFKSNVEFESGGDLLCIRGYIWDTIEEVGEFNDGDTKDDILLIDRLGMNADEQRVWNSWETVSRARSEVKYPTGEDILDAFWQTLIAGNMPDGYDASREQFKSWNNSTRLIFRHLPLEKLKGFYRKVIVSCHTMLTGNILVFIIATILRCNAETAEEVEERKFFRFKMAIGMNRRMIRTKTGFIGLAAQLAEKGDKICLFEGGRIPLILRSKGAYWQLIGDSYVHGIVQGGSFVQGKCKKMRLI